MKKYSIIFLIFIFLIMISSVNAADIGLNESAELNLENEVSSETIPIYEAQDADLNNELELQENYSNEVTDVADQIGRAHV